MDGSYNTQIEVKQRQMMTALRKKWMKK